MPVNFSIHRRVKYGTTKIYKRAQNYMCTYYISVLQQPILFRAISASVFYNTWSFNVFWLIQKLSMDDWKKGGVIRCDRLSRYRRFQQVTRAWRLKLKTNLKLKQIFKDDTCIRRILRPLRDRLPLGCQINVFSFRLWWSPHPTRHCSLPPAAIISTWCPAVRFQL